MASRARLHLSNTLHSDNVRSSSENSSDTVVYHSPSRSTKSSTTISSWKSSDFTFFISIDVPDILRPYYDVTGLIATGGFGAVYAAVDCDHRKCAIKVQEIERDVPPMLNKETEIYQNLLVDSRTGFPLLGFPRVYNYMALQEHEFLVMDLLGESLRQKQGATSSGKFSKKTGLMIGIQVVRRLQKLHENHILHRDIKPDNLVMGLGPEEKTVHIIDFGISKTVEDWENYDPDEHEPFRGTTNFAPAEAFFERNATRAGDLQSLAFTLLHMVTGEIDWSYHDEGRSRILTPAEIGVIRIAKDSSELCKDFPELTRFVGLVRAIKKQEEPNYDMLVEELEDVLRAVGCENDGMYDWIIDRDNETKQEVSSEQEQKSSSEQEVEEKDGDDGLNTNARVLQAVSVKWQSDQSMETSGSHIGDALQHTQLGARLIARLKLVSSTAIRRIASGFKHVGRWFQKMKRLFCNVFAH